MRFFEEESVIFLCIVVASFAEVFDTLVQVLKIPIPNNFITFTAIILFFIVLFAIIGFAILAMSIISELKNTFPDFRKVFEK